MAEDPKTPVEVSDALSDYFLVDESEAIAAEVYQPLLDEIKRLEERVAALEKEYFKQSLAIRDDQ